MPAGGDTLFGSTAGANAYAYDVSPVSLAENPFLTSKDAGKVSQKQAHLDYLRQQHHLDRQTQKEQVLFVDTAKLAGMDVRAKVNQLLAENGYKDLTRGQPLISVFGDPDARNKSQTLKVTKGESSLTFQDHKGSSVYDLSPLFEESGPWKVAQKSAYASAIENEDQQNEDPIKAWYDGYLPDGTSPSQSGKPVWGPDGYLIDPETENVKVLKMKDKNRIEEGWFEGLDRTDHQAMLAINNFHELCALVDTAQEEAQNQMMFPPDIRWVNDPAVFPLPKTLRGEGGQENPWEDGVMAFQPDNRNYFVSRKMKENQYRLDVWIGEWNNLPCDPPPTGRDEFYLRAMVNHKTIISTDVIKTPPRPDFDTFYAWGQVDNYQLPQDFDLPDAMDYAGQPGQRPIMDLLEDEKDMFGVHFFIIDKRTGRVKYQGKLPPEYYYHASFDENNPDKKTLKYDGQSDFWGPVPLLPVEGTTAPNAKPQANGQQGTPRQQAPPPTVVVHVRLHASWQEPKKSFWETYCPWCQMCNCCCANKGEKEAYVGPPPEMPKGQDWNLDSKAGGSPFGGVVVPKPKTPEQEQREAVARNEAMKEHNHLVHEQHVIKPMKEDPLDSCPWIRLTDFGHSGSEMGFACVFDTTSQEKSNCGRVYKGELDNEFFVEALNAISCRPKLARQLFYIWDVNKAIYILRMMCNGSWLRVEIDDFVPPRMSDSESNEDNGQMAMPSCCYSENFPFVLWPSLVEKAYAKCHTVRPPFGHSGGWEACAGGGRPEEAMADLTGGVAGRFYTRDVSYDRLFVYFYHLQRLCLWVARPQRSSCRRHGVCLDSTSAYVVNRAAAYNGHCFVQLFSASGSLQTGGAGLETFSVPYELIESFPEKSGGSYFWVSILDFVEYFDTVFECRLTSSTDVGLPGMPEGQMPRALTVPAEQQGMGPNRSGCVGPPLFKEMIWANRGRITPANEPEFEIFVPPGACPCEVSAVLQQSNPRVDQVGQYRPLACPVLLKVYQQVGEDRYYNELVCRSNWLPIRDASVSFNVKRGGTFLIVCEMQMFSNDPSLSQFTGPIFRCYAAHNSVTCIARKSQKRHALVSSTNGEGLKAMKWTLVGCRKSGDDSEPEPYSPHADGLSPPVDTDGNAACSIM